MQHLVSILPYTACMSRWKYDVTPLVFAACQAVLWPCMYTWCAWIWHSISAVLWRKSIIATCLIVLQCTVNCLKWFSLRSLVQRHLSANIVRVLCTLISYFSILRLCPSDREPRGHANKNPRDHLSIISDINLTTETCVTYVDAPLF